MYSPINLQCAFLQFWSLYLGLGGHWVEASNIWEDELRTFLFGKMMRIRQLYLRGMVKGRHPVLGTGKEKASWRWRLLGGREVPFEQLTVCSRSRRKTEKRLPEIGRLPPWNMAGRISLTKDQGHRRVRNCGQTGNMCLAWLFSSVLGVPSIFCWRKSFIPLFCCYMSFSPSACQLFEGMDYVFNF